MKYPDDKEWYTVRSILGYSWAFFYILLGGREAGKSYSAMNFFLNQWKKKKKPFTWLRLKESSTKKLLANNAMEFVDADLRRKYDLELTVKGNTVFDHGEPMARVLALSTFYNDKGVALFDNDFDLGYNICLDEMNQEKSEKRTFDICYAFVNQLENLVRSTKEKMNIILIGNTLEEASDIVSLFDFIPETFGRYSIKKKKAIIEYIPENSAYKARRKGTVADLLMPDCSTFTNEVKIDRSLITKNRLIKPQMVIKFSKEKSAWFTVWDNLTVARYNGEKCNNIVPMRPYLDHVFSVDRRDIVIGGFDARSYRYHDLITFKLFQKQLQLLRKG